MAETPKFPPIEPWYSSTYPTPDDVEDAWSRLSVAELRAQIDALQAENERLWGRVRTDDGEIDGLRAENERLRKRIAELEVQSR